MLRLSPPAFRRFLQAEGFELTYSGAEANVAVTLANFGLEASFVSKVPDNDIGQAAINYLRRYGVKTDGVLRGGNRLGLFYLEMGASQRSSKVIYDRAASSFSEVEPNEFDWTRILENAVWFHLTGITPALGAGPEKAALEAVKIADSLGIKVSIDLNYRAKLWDSKRANKVMTEFMPYVDLLVCNEEDAEKVFGIAALDSDVSSGQINEAGYRWVARELTNRFGLQKVAITLRKSITASDNGWSALLYADGEFYHSKEYRIHIVDRVGGGDSFSGGLIYSLLSGKSPQDALEFAVAASCLKHSIFGDFNLASLSEVENLVSGDASGRVQR